MAGERDLGGLDEKNNFDQKVALLRNVRLFNAFNDAEIEAIAGIAAEVRFKKGDVVYEKGAVSDSLYVVKSGEVAARGVTTLHYGPGYSFGEMALLTRQPYPTTITVESEEAVLLAVGNEPFESFLSENTLIIDELLQEMARREAGLSTGQVVTEDRSMLIYLMHREELLADAIVAQGYRIEDVLDESGRLTAVKLEKVNDQTT